MNVVRTGLRTGLLVVLTLAGLTAALVYLGAPGAFTPQKEFSIYFDNAAGLREGTPVMLAGRKVGQVIAIVSPVPVAERPPRESEKDPPLEVRLTVRVEASAKIYQVTKVRLASYGFLDEPVIDFTGGVEGSGLAEPSTHFVGERPGGLADTGTQIIEKLEPAVNQLVETLKTLDTTAANIGKLTSDEGDLAKTFMEFRVLGKNLADLTGPNGTVQRALAGFEKLTGDQGEVAAAVKDLRRLLAPDADLAKALANAEKFTRSLSQGKEVPAILSNFQAASNKLNVAIADLQRDLGATAKNLSQGSDTLKRQPWRLIWPTTKKYPEERAAQKSPPPKRPRGSFRMRETKPE